MVDLLDQIAKQKARLQKEQQDKAQAEARERQRKQKLARAVEALETRQAILIGETIRDTELTPAERAIIGAILGRRAVKPKDWRVIAEWLLPNEEPANDPKGEFHPATDAGGTHDAPLSEAATGS